MVPGVMGSTGKRVEESGCGRTAGILGKKSLIYSDWAGGSQTYTCDKVTELDTQEHTH